MTFDAPVERASLRDITLLLVAAAGLSGCITIVFLAMRAVMDVGGACADGGPFVPVQSCPDGVPLLMTFAIFGLFGFGGLGFLAGSRVGGAWISLPLLGWPALFLSLGWNFLEYGFWPKDGGGWIWGWVIPGVLFVVVGAGPVWFAWTARRVSLSDGSGVSVASTFGLPTSAGRAVRISYAPPANVLDARATAGHRQTGVDLVERLERLAHLRRTGDLTDAEFEIAKAALLAAADARDA